MLKIDDHVPAPAKGHHRKLYPFDALKEGQSFFVPNKTQQDLSPVANYWTRKTGAKFTLRSVKEAGVRGIRIWRVEQSDF